MWAGVVYTALGRSRLQFGDSAGNILSLFEVVLLNLG